MYFKPSPLSKETLDAETLKADKQACKKFGPCGVGEKALYLSSLFLDRRFYVPVARVQRAYKRIAMSKGGFSGKGIFGAIPYLVVEYDNGQQVQCTFKFEQNVDMLLADVRKRHPHIKTISAAAAKRLAEARAAEQARLKKDLSPQARQSIAELTQARDYLEQKPELSERLAAASKAKRVNEAANPAYKWVALAIMLLGAASAVYGVWSMVSGTGSSGVYFLLIGMAFIFLFASANVLPTARNNRRAVDAELAAARSEMTQYLQAYGGDFPLPARYAHPATLTRMIRSIAEGRAEDIAPAYEDMKAGLKALNHTVQVTQEEYDEVVAIKPMFLLENYQ